MQWTFLASVFHPRYHIHYFCSWSLLQSGSSEAENVGIQCHREGLAVTAMAGSVTRPTKTLKAGVSLQIAEGLTKSL